MLAQPLNIGIHQKLSNRTPRTVFVERYKPSIMPRMSTQPSVPREWWHYLALVIYSINIVIAHLTLDSTNANFFHRLLHATPLFKLHPKSISVPIFCPPLLSSPSCAYHPVYNSYNSPKTPQQVMSHKLNNNSTSGLMVKLAVAIGQLRVRFAASA